MDVSMPARQSGAALLTLILLIVIGSAWLLLDNLNATAIQNQRDEHDARVLAEAKDALIAYAATYSDLDTPGEYGFLPCPDTGIGAMPEGGAHVVCGGRYENSLGRLPWRTLGMDPLKDSAGECLWYAVSGQYKHSGTFSPEMLNPDTNGTFEVYSSNNGVLIAGDSPKNRPVAVIFSAGEPSNSQDRSSSNPADVENCGGNYDAENYLESLDLGGLLGTINNASINEQDGINKIVSGKSPADPAFNDKTVHINKNDIWTAINKRKDLDYQDSDDLNYIKDFASWVGACMARVGDDTGSNYSLPYPGIMQLEDLSSRDYRKSQQYIDINPDNYTEPNLFGRLPLYFKNSYCKKNGLDSSSCDSVPQEQYNLSEFCDLTSGPDYGVSVSEEYQDEHKAFLENWKDHVFYAVSDLYTAKENWPPAESCATKDGCITIESDPNYYAAVIMFSGKDLDNLSTFPGNQSRRNITYDVARAESNDDRRLASNYIESPNLDKFVDLPQNLEPVEYKDQDGDAPLMLELPENSLPNDEFNDVYICLLSNTNDNSIVAVTECPGFAYPES